MRENGFRALGGLAQRLTGSLTEKRGPGKGGSKGRGTAIARLRVEWTSIVGSDLARVTEPDAMLADRGSGKMLRLKVEAAMALEIQHRAPQIVERLNAHFGHRLIDDIRLVQTSLAPRPVPPVRPAQPKPDASTLQQFERRAAEVSDPKLRAALVRLGARIASRRDVVRGAGLGLFAVLVRSERSRADDDVDKLLGVRPGDHVLGKADAPNIIIDYFSLTCPHCANFQVAVLPKVKSEWIDTGRARFVYRHFPSDQVATQASLLAECRPVSFFDTVDLLFKSQVDWLTARQPEEALIGVMERAGLPARDCLSDSRLFDKVVGDVQSGQALGVKFTPTLFINEQKYGNPEGGSLGIDAILHQVGR
jgi:protein-disulfide isomerase